MGVAHALLQLFHMLPDVGQVICSWLFKTATPVSPQHVGQPPCSNLCMCNNITCYVNYIILMLGQQWDDRKQIYTWPLCSPCALYIWLLRLHVCMYVHDVNNGASKFVDHLMYLKFLKTWHPLHASWCCFKHMALSESQVSKVVPGYKVAEAVRRH